MTPSKRTRVLDYLNFAADMIVLGALACSTFQAEWGLLKAVGLAVFVLLSNHCYSLMNRLRGEP